MEKQLNLTLLFDLFTKKCFDKVCLLILGWLRLEWEVWTSLTMWGQKVIAIDFRGDFDLIGESIVREGFIFHFATFKLCFELDSQTFTPITTILPLQWIEIRPNYFNFKSTTLLPLCNYISGISSKFPLQFTWVFIRKPHLFLLFDYIS